MEGFSLISFLTFLFALLQAFSSGDIAGLLALFGG